jgi:hypothetical protein
VLLLFLVGRDNGDPLFLQIKEAQASVLESALGTSTAATRTAGVSSRDSG